MRWLRLLLAPALLFGCTSHVDPGGAARYPQDDLALFTPFDPSTLLAEDDFSDTHYTDDDVQRYLEHTHYNSRSFLADYRSGDCGQPARWCTAAHATVLAAKTHGVSPRVLLAFAEVEGQLLEATSYPQPSTRAEYTFACGCTLEGCQSNAAGFDEQVACLAARLGRAHEDAWRVGGRTGRGVAVGATFRTADGHDLTPTNAATASIYEVLPDLSEGTGGAWMVAALFQKVVL